MDLSVIIVNWNSLAYLRVCLASIRLQCRLEHFEVIVVDGGSFDGCDRMLAQEFPWVRFIQSPTNVGFARANNLGARNARGRNLVFLNPDTVLLDDAFTTLQRGLDLLPQAGAVGCRLLNGDRTLQTSCVQSFPGVVNQFLDADWLRAVWPSAGLWGTAPLYATRPAPCEAVSGACLAVRHDAFEQVGGFTESYFMYGEDLDLCCKLRAAGWQNYHLPEKSIIHFGGGSSRQAPSGASIVMMRHAVRHFLQLNRGPMTAAAYQAAMGIAATFRLALIGLARLAQPANARAGAAWRKWSAILRWSLGYAAPQPAVAPLLATSAGRS